MAKKRSGPFSLKEERQLIQMAATSATLEKAAAVFRTSVDTIERKAKRLGIKLKGKRAKARAQGEEMMLILIIVVAYLAVVAGFWLVIAVVWDPWAEFREVQSGLKAKAKWS
jgi:hypothetical protein